MSQSSNCWNSAASLRTAYSIRALQTWLISCLILIKIKQKPKTTENWGWNYCTCALTSSLNKIWIRPCVLPRTTAHTGLTDESTVHIELVSEGNIHMFEPQSDLGWAECWLAQLASCVCTVADTGTQTLVGLVLPALLCRVDVFGSLGCVPR